MGKSFFEELQSLAILRGIEVPGPRPRTFGSQKRPSTKENKNWKEYIFDIKLKKETRRKEINASQLAIRNFNGEICKQILINPL